MFVVSGKGTLISLSEYGKEMRSQTNTLIYTIATTTHQHNLANARVRIKRLDFFFNQKNKINRRGIRKTNTHLV